MRHKNRTPIPPADSQISRWLPLRLLSGVFFGDLFCVLLFSTSALSFLLQSDINSLDDEKHDHCCHHRTSSITDKRKCHTGQRNEFRTAADGQENLENIHNADAVYDKLIKSVMNPHRDPNHFKKAADTDQDQAHTEDHTQFLADGRKDEIRFHIGNCCRVPL